MKKQTNNLTSLLKKYKTGWVAIDDKKKLVVGHAKDFATISNKIKQKNNVVLMPVSDNYFGFITTT